MFKTAAKCSQSTGGFVCVRFGGLSLGVVFVIGVFCCCCYVKNCTNMVLYQEGFEVDRLRPYFTNKTKQTKK